VDKGSGPPPTLRPLPRNVRPGVCRDPCCVQPARGIHPSRHPRSGGVPPLPSGQCLQKFLSPWLACCPLPGTPEELRPGPRTERRETKLTLSTGKRLLKTGSAVLARDPRLLRPVTPPGFRNGGSNPSHRLAGDAHGASRVRRGPGGGHSVVAKHPSRDTNHYTRREDCRQGLLANSAISLSGWSLNGTIAMFSRCYLSPCQRHTLPVQTCFSAKIVWRGRGRDRVHEKWT
jgi:hypothetical protein